MKRRILVLMMLIFFSLACSIGGLFDSEDTDSQDGNLSQSEERCGDGVCNGSEDTKSCPQDCSTDSDQTEPSTEESVEASSDYGILYQFVEYSFSSDERDSETCYAINFARYLDGGLINPDGSGNRVLELKDYPTSMVTSKVEDMYYYVSSPQDPVQEMFGFFMFNWDVGEQTLWASDYSAGTPVEVAQSGADGFPGGVNASPENQYLLYPMTHAAQMDQEQDYSIAENRFNPFVSDSSLVIADLEGGGEKKVLSESYNRYLFSCLDDFSSDGEYFFTIARDGDSFKLVRISLASGEVAEFTQVFPGFDWEKLDWDEIFPREDGFSFAASFSISPDEKRLIAFRNIYTFNMENVCVAADATYNLWIFDLEANTLQRFENQKGHISNLTWKYDGSQYALSIVDETVCYPDYVNSRIDTFNKDGQMIDALVSEPKSRITNISWSPDGGAIAYDVYSTDFIGCLKMVDVSTKDVSEVTNTQALGYQVDLNKPVLLWFADWVSLK